VLDLALCRRLGRDPVDLARAAALGGAGVVQVRDKQACGRDLLAVVRAVTDAVVGTRPQGATPAGADTGPAGTAVVVNDRVDVFLAARAAGTPVGGVHVGQDDLPAPVVRSLVGPGALLGVSAATPDDIRAAAAEGVADYLGVGPVHATAAKVDA